MEWFYGSDPQLCDSDGDGLPDGLEAGILHPSTATDLEAGCFIPDEDPTTQTSILLADSDGGGLDDGQEDRNLNGKQDPWEVDPTNSLDDFDSDNDTIPDALEEQCPQGLSDDADGDGIPDSSELYNNTDNDELLDFCDPDDDNDGIPSIEEGTDDLDNDGLGNAYDTDSDGDEIPDDAELNWDVDCDGKPEYLDADPHDGPCSDSDGDGLYNEDELECGSDPFNADSDGDGIIDSEEECGSDTQAPAVDIPQLEYTEDTPLKAEGCQSSPSQNLWLFLVVLLYRRRC